MNAYHHATLTFISQNYGAFKFDRIKKGLAAGLVSVVATGVILGGLVCLFPEEAYNFYPMFPRLLPAAARESVT